jgi:N-formylglutamate amidohydrolase
MAYDGAPSSPAAPIEVREPSARVVPLVLASPHSGRAYSAEFLAASRLDLATLRRSEDSFVDEIFAEAPRLGAPLLRALFPRAYIDVNREAFELDQAMFSDALPPFANVSSLRVRMGLGTIARIVASGEEIYAGKLAFAEANRRIEGFYRPYHRALSQLLGETEEVFGGYLLIDCHSMPSPGAVPRCERTADIVLGDCHGTACAGEIAAAARHFLAERGFFVAMNAPYAGGFTTNHYGRPPLCRHALQIEINRALYMDERRYEKKPALLRLAEEMALLVERLGEVVAHRLARAGRPPGGAARD